MKRPTIPCPCCRGKARVPLPDEYRETLKRLRRHPFGATGEMLALPIGATARAQQLKRLETWGLVRRIGKQGKAIVWLLAGEAAPPPLPKVLPCVNCGKLPEWRRNGNSNRHRLVHSMATCPNRVAMVDHRSDAHIARQWNTATRLRLP